MRINEREFDIHGKVVCNPTLEVMETTSKIFRCYYISSERHRIIVIPRYYIHT